MKLAATYAQLGREREAEHSLYRAYRYFPPHPAEDPAFLYADCGEPSLSLWDGLTHLALSQISPTDDRTAQMHVRLAWESLDLFGGAHPRFVVSERNHVEILIQQARTAIALDDLERFIASFSNAVTGTKTLGSERRRRGKRSPSTGKPAPPGRMKNGSATWQNCSYKYLLLSKPNACDLINYHVFG